MREANWPNAAMILDHRPPILYWSGKGANEKSNKMYFDVDSALWVLMGIAVLFVVCGCVLTAPPGTYRRNP
jgi:hypothetical protein